MLAALLAATTGDVTKAGKAIGLALGVGLGALGAGIGIGNIFGSMIQSVARQPELRGELQGIQWLGFALTEAVVFYGLLGSISRLRPGLRVSMLLVATNALIKVTPGLMIWTIVCFLIALFVLKRYAFGPIQNAIDERRERIRESLDEADRAREEARKLLEEHRKLIGKAKADAEEILAEAPQAGGRPARARPGGDRGRPAAPARGDEEADRGRDPARARADPHRGRRADADRRHPKVTGKVLDRDDHRQLIEEAIGELDFSVLERND